MFDALKGERGRDIALQRVEDAASEKFKAAAMNVIGSIARTRKNFTTDRVWFVLNQQGVREPREPRVMGALMRNAVKEGWIKATPQFVQSVKSSNHRRPVKVWESLIYGNGHA